MGLIINTKNRCSNSQQKTNFVELAKEIKLNLDREKVTSIITFIGIEVMRNYRFKDDPSFSISKDGLIHDFGSTGFSNDIFAYIEKEKSISFVESVKFVADCLGVIYE